jgi:hypothetical protein
MSNFLIFQPFSPSNTQKINKSKVLSEIIC